MSLLVRTSTDAGALLVRDTDDPLALAVTESTSPLALRVRESTSPLAMRVRGLFSPASLPGLAAWYDASDPATVLTTVSPDVPASNGQTVRRWLDKSGNGRHLNQADLTLQPVYDSDGFLQGDGLNDVMSAIGTMPGGRLLSVHVLALQPTTALTQPSLVSVPGSGFLNMYRVSTNAGGSRFVSSSGITIPGTSYDTPYVISVCYNGVNVVGYVNGAQTTSSTTLDGGETFSSIHIFDNVPTSRPCDAQIREIIICAAQNTATETAKIAAYMRRKAGL
jgi:hypothetical protein